MRLTRLLRRGCVLSGALFLCLALPLAGCGGADEQDQAGNQGQQGQEQQAQARPGGGQSGGGQSGSGQRTAGQRPHGQRSGGQHGPGQPRPEQRPGGGQRPDRPATPVAVQAASTGDIASYYQATATLEAEKQAEILARATGIIGSLACEEGDLVRQGQELLRIQNDEYRLRLRQAEANTANLRARHDRMARMLAEELTSTEEYDAARSELASAEADEGLARLNVSYTAVTAPFTGKIVQRLVDVGQNVSDGTPLFLIADFDPLLARVYVPAKEFRKLEQAQPVQLVLDSDQQRLSGKIKLISPTIDPTSGTIKITVEITEYPENTRPGDFTEVRVVTERRTDTTLVPRTAVVSDKGEDVVFVASDGAAERRIVSVGFTDSDHAEILDGVQPGELVVIKGQRSLKHGMPLKILEGGPAEADAEAEATAAAHPANEGT